MSGELVKWKGGKPVKAVPVAEMARALSEALAVFKPAPVPPARAIVAADMADLVRVCAVHGRPYAARYIRGADGRFRRGPMLQLTVSMMERQYGDAGSALVPGADIADETCPWCGAFGRGAVHCGKCGGEMCFGRTVRDVFTCHPLCGHRGKIVFEQKPQEGLVASAGRWPL
jgi:hypothetical protein